MISAETQKVLWIRIGAIGDLLIATAALQETIRNFPKAEVTVWGPRFWIEILDPTIWTQVSIIAVASQQDQMTAEIFKRALDGRWQPTGESRTYKQVVKTCGAVVNHRIESFRYAWAPFFARTPLRIGSCPAPYRFLYTHYSPWLGKDPDIHERDWHLLVAVAHSKKITTVGDARAWAEKEISQNPRLAKWKQKGLPQLQRSRTPTLQPLLSIGGAPYWLINPTSSRKEKAWPVDRFRELVHMLSGLAKEQRAQIFVIGAPHETDWLQAVASNLVPVLQPPTLQELISIVEHAEILVANASSMQYFASSTNTPCLSLIGRTNPKQWGPLGARSFFIKGTTPEVKTSSIFEEDFEYLKTISVGQVITKILKILNPL